MQVRSFVWTQHCGGDVLSPTDLLEVSPPIFEMPAGGSQLVRLVLRAAPQGAEAAYRMLFDQLPTASGTGVTIALRFSVPLFAEPAAGAAPDMDAHIERQGGGAVLVVRNRGSRHDRLLSPALSGPGGRLNLAGNTNFYVLAGSEQCWPLSGRTAALRPGTQVQLTGNTLSGRLNTVAAVRSP